MKTLYICRHAKSSWSFNLDDFDRPLGVRGRKDVVKMGKYLKSHHNKPDLIITSPASRALYTALFLADEWGYAEDQIVLEPELYHGSVSTMIHLLQRQSGTDSIALFGHNPGLSELAYKLSRRNADDMPTCSVIGLNFDINEWNEVSKQAGMQFTFITPKTISLS